jgi:hypothetical protein
MNTSLFGLDGSQYLCRSGAAVRELDDLLSEGSEGISSGASKGSGIAPAVVVQCRWAARKLHSPSAVRERPGGELELAASKLRAALAALDSWASGLA